MVKVKGSLCDFINVIVITAMLSAEYLAGPGARAAGTGGALLAKEHRTQAAAERTRDLWCYHCDTMADGGDRCVDLHGNRTDQHLKCHQEKRTCMVKKISITTSNENTTSSPRLWLLQRTCSKHCEPGCIMIGERTKLHACTTCCEGDFCNSGSGQRRLRPAAPVATATATAIALALALPTFLFPLA